MLNIYKKMLSELLNKNTSKIEEISKVQVLSKKTSEGQNRQKIIIIYNNKNQ
jgi:hypothetical protein